MTDSREMPDLLADKDRQIASLTGQLGICRGYTARLLEKVRGLKKPEPKWNDDFMKRCKVEGYNAALQDVEKLLEGK